MTEKYITPTIDLTKEDIALPMSIDEFKFLVNHGSCAHNNINVIISIDFIELIESYNFTKVETKINNIIFNINDLDNGLILDMYNATPLRVENNNIIAEIHCEYFLP